jgi:hypothetical protein
VVLTIDVTATDEYANAKKAGTVWYAGTISAAPLFRIMAGSPKFGGEMTGWVICETGEAEFSGFSAH